MSRSLSDQAPYTRSQLEAMTKAELLVVAQKLGVEGLSDRTLKADMIDAILGVSGWGC